MRRRGFIILFGTRSITTNDQGVPLYTRCPRCQRETNLVPKSYRSWFTLFFIPVFPVSGKNVYSECSGCGAQFPIGVDQLRASLAASEQEQSQQAITLYNSLRTSPGNSVALNQLMALYASMKEFGQAISAANNFPQALNSSEQCMVTLARVLLAQDQHADAMRWLDAAIARNPLFGEAQYFKALTHLTAKPSDPAQAVSAARAARSAGFPGAEELLREAESKARVI